MEKIVFLKLIDNYLDGTASPAERELLEEYYQRLETSGSTELSAEQEEVLHGQNGLVPGVRRSKNLE